MIRPFHLASGLLVLALAWLGPLPRLARDSFAAHMTMHMAVVAVAAPLLVLGVTGSRWDPVMKWPALFPPIPLSLVELAVVWAWHAPGLHHFARGNAAGLVAEQGSFLVSGLLVWFSAYGGGVRRPIERSGAGVAGLLLTSMHMTLLGALLALSPRPLYLHAGTLATLTRLEDQHLGGAVMLVVGGIAYFAGGVWLTSELVRTRVKPSEEGAS